MVAIGVMLAVAIHTVNHSALASFGQALDTVNGQASAQLVAPLGEMDDLSLPDLTRVRYEFQTATGQTVSGWRRYGIDGYGEDIVSGEAYANGPGQTNTAGQRGRVWPFFSGERGHYELARALLQKPELSETELAPLRTQSCRAVTVGER